MSTTLFTSPPKNSKASKTTCWARGWQKHAQFAKVCQGISPTPLKLNWLPLKSSGLVTEGHFLS